MKRLIFAGMILAAMTAGCSQNTLNKSGPTGGSKHAAEAKHVTLTAENFDQEVLQSSQPVLVDFWAPWCGPCVAFGPTVDAIADEYAGKLKVAKVDIEDQQALGVKFNAERIPLFIVFKDGKEVARKNPEVGVDRKTLLKQLVDQVVQ